MAELSLSVLGLALPTIQAVISAKSHSTDRKTSRLDAVTIAELQNDLGEEWFDAIHSNLRLYEEVVEPNVDEKDRVFASVIRARICHIIEDMQATAQELARASKNPQSKEKDLIANKDKLEELGKYLNRFLFVMSSRLGIRQFQNTMTDGGAPTESSSPTLRPESLKSTLRETQEPLRLEYDSDPQLKRPVTNEEIEVLEDMLSPQQGPPGPTARSSLALLLACREQRPKVVRLCLDYSAYPNVMDENGLSAIHNAIGTADQQVHDLPEVVEILALLMDHGVDISIPDGTEQEFRPLHRTAKTKNVSATKRLLAENPDIVNLTDAKGNTALYHACAQPNQKIPLIQELLDKGANFAGKARPPMPDRNGQSIGQLLDERNLR